MANKKEKRVPTKEEFAELLAKHGHKKLPVYYGFRKLNKIVKKKSICVVFACDPMNERMHEALKKILHVVYERMQTPEECTDCDIHNRVFTVYEIKLDHKAYNGDIQLALDDNFTADENHVSVSERLLIRKKLENFYKANYV